MRRVLRRPIQCLCFLALTLYAPPSTLSLSYGAEPGQLAENQARFGVIEGDVGFLAQGAKEWQEPHEGLPLEPGDHIRTAEDGRVELQLGKGVLWVLEPESEAVAEHVSDHTGRMDLVEGTILGIVDPAISVLSERWEMNTPAAVITAHGSQTAIQFSPKEGTRLGVFEGHVEIQAADSPTGESVAVQVSANHEAVVTRRQPVPKISPLGPIMRGFLNRRKDMRLRQARAEQGWSVWNPVDRISLRKKYVAAPPKPKHTKPRVLRLKGKAKSDESVPL